MYRYVAASNNKTHVKLITKHTLNEFNKLIANGIEMMPHPMIVDKVESVQPTRP